MIELSHVTKYFPRTKKPLQKLRYYTSGTLPVADAKLVIDDLSLSIARGQILGVVGMNGSGKSTLLKLIADIIRPDKGTIRINGTTNQLQAHAVGITVGADRCFFPRLTGRQNLLFFGRLFGLTPRAARRRIECLDQVLRLGDILDCPVQSLSSGMRQKIVLSRALLHSPAVLLLDEPTVHLDWENRSMFYEGLAAAHAEFKLTVLWVSHYLADFETQCTRICYLSDRKLRWQGTPAEFRQTFFTGAAPRQKYGLTADGDCGVISEAALFCPPPELLTELLPGAREMPPILKSVRADTTAGKKRIFRGPRDLWRTCVLFVGQELAQRRRNGVFFQDVMSAVVPVMSFYFISRVVQFRGDIVGAGAPDYFSFTVVGMICMGFLSCAHSGFSQSVRMAQYTGIMELVLASPVAPLEYVVASNAYGFLYSGARLAVLLCVAGFLGVSFFSDWSRAVAAAAAVACGVLAFSGLGILSAAVTLLTRRANPAQMLAGTVSGFLSGVYFPLTALPSWIQWSAALIPLTYVLNAVRYSMFSAHFRLIELWHHLIPLLLISGIFLPVGMALFLWAVGAAKRSGTVSFY